MSHGVITRDLGRSRSQRKALVRGLTQALFRSERIVTTLARAKETQRFAERLITLGKAGSLADRRRAIQLLSNPEGVGRLFSQIAPRFSNRAGGYTRIFHNGHRGGDGASMAVLELVELAPEKKQLKLKTKKEKQPKGSPEAPKPPAEKPRPKPPEPKEEKPRLEKPKPEKPEQKPKGFLEGLRKFFKKDRPR